MSCECNKRPILRTLGVSVVPGPTGTLTIAVQPETFLLRGFYELFLGEVLDGIQGIENVLLSVTTGSGATAVTTTYPLVDNIGLPVVSGQLRNARFTDSGVRASRYLLQFGVFNSAVPSNAFYVRRGLCPILGISPIATPPTP